MKTISSAEEVYKMKIAKWKMPEGLLSSIDTLMITATMLDIDFKIKITDAYIRRVIDDLDHDGGSRHKFSITFKCPDSEYKLNLLCATYNLTVEGVQILKDETIFIESWHDCIDAVMDSMQKILAR